MKGLGRPGWLFLHKRVERVRISPASWQASWLAGWLVDWLRGRRFTCKQSARALRFTRNIEGPQEVIDLTENGQPLEFWGAVLNPLSLLLLDPALPVANKLVLTSDRVYLCACILPGDLLFCAPEGRIAPIGASYPEWIILSRIGDLIPKR